MAKIVQIDNKGKWSEDISNLSRRKYFLIGRSELGLKDLMVSRKHCFVFKDDGGRYFLGDFDSDNGTFYCSREGSTGGGHWQKLPSAYNCEGFGRFRDSQRIYPKTKEGKLVYDTKGQLVYQEPDRDEEFYRWLGSEGLRSLAGSEEVRELKDFDSFGLVMGEKDLQPKYVFVFRD